MTDAKSDAGEPPRRRLSLKVQFVVLLCLAMGPAAVIGFFESLSAFQRQTLRTEQALLQATMISVLADRQVIAGAQVLLELMAEQEPVRTAQAPACAILLRNALLRSDDYEGMVISDATGQLRCASRQDPVAANFADRGWFREVMGGAEFATSTLLTSRVTGSSTVIAAAPLRNADGTIIGAVSMAIHIAALTKRLGQAPTGLHPVMVLLDGAGQAVSEDRTPDMSKLPPSDEIRRHRTGEGAVFRTAGTDGTVRLYALVPVIGEKLMVIAAEELPAVGPNGLTASIVVGLPLLIWLVAMLTMWIGLERLVLRWVSYLRRVGASYAGGHYLVMPRKVDQAPSEFQELGFTLSQMALTARERQNDLRAALEQKSALVREVHHRVKNNLQIIQSLLNLQSRSASDSNQFTALAAAKSRINALALVHQSLYEDENLEFINLQSFLNDLCRHLLQSGWGAAKRVGIDVDVPQIITTADCAVPISLLVTEAVTNALKHAFFGRDSGSIVVRLVNDPGDGAELTISDNGIGMETMPQSARGERHPGIGYSLIEGFARQLRGTVTTSADAGTTVIVRFPYLKNGRPAAK